MSSPPYPRYSSQKPCKASHVGTVTANDNDQKRLKSSPWRTVPDDSVRLAMKLESLDETASGYRLVLECELELKDSPRPALVARWIVLVTEKEV